MHPDWFRDIYARYFDPTCGAYFCNQTEADIFRYQMYWIIISFPFEEKSKYSEEEKNYYIEAARRVRALPQNLAVLWANLGIGHGTAKM